MSQNNSKTPAAPDSDVANLVKNVGGASTKATPDEGCLFPLAGEKNGIQRIHAERQRQINEKGYTDEHDDSHNTATLALAAACYTRHTVDQERGHASAFLPRDWPWHQGEWKPSELPIRNLEKAGALIAAEIDRLLRAEVRP